MTDDKRQAAAGTIADEPAEVGEDPAAVSTNGESHDPYAQIAELTARQDDLIDQLQRGRAEFANYRRRVEQEREQIREIANRALLTQIVPLLDDLQRALAVVPDEQRDSPWVQGVSNIERKFARALERAGVTPIDALGQPFDPALHEAVATEPGSSGGVVAEVYQTGYRLGQALLRPAMVKVGDRAAEDPVSA